MLSYILLFLIIAAIILCVIRFSKPRYPNSRKQHEPFLGMHQVSQETEPDHEGIIGEPRIVRTDQPKTAPVENNTVELNHPHTYLGHYTDRPIKKTPHPVEPEVQPIDVVVINLLADAGRPYSGYELLQTILRKGFRYGKWHIFHYHAQPLGRGPVLFSLASSVEPGTFDLTKMDSFSSPALTLFMNISNTDQPHKALEKCLQIATQMVSELGGQVCDEKRKPMTPEKVQSWRGACRE